MGVWQPHHAARHNHHAISLQPNCMMLGWHAQRQVQGILVPGMHAERSGGCLCVTQGLQGCHVLPFTA